MPFLLSVAILPSGRKAASQKRLGRTRVPSDRCCSMSHKRSRPDHCLLEAGRQILPVGRERPSFAESNRPAAVPLLFSGRLEILEHFQGGPGEEHRPSAAEIDVQSASAHLASSD